ncbi:MAG: AbrB family transcriptional regulator [Eubacteriales bacterium]|nr:AbrB family transcriptional regulator [Eubacteriales bacterium]
MEKYGKHIFGTVKVGEKGQIVIPKKARDIFNINAGDMMLVLGDETQGGLAVMKSDTIVDFARAIVDAAQNAKPEEADEDA